MNNIVISFGLIFLLIIVISMISKFFGIKEIYYIPFIIWGITLCIFNLILEKNHTNIFLKNIE